MKKFELTKRFYPTTGITKKSYVKSSGKSFFHTISLVCTALLPA